PVALIIAPTRELTLQIFDVLRPLASPKYKTTAVYGGHSFETEAKSLSAGADIVVGTPGRILDHINRRRLDLYATQVLVVDEYDKALELGFADDMERIFRCCRRVRTTVLTSATKGEVPAFVGMVDRTLDYSKQDEQQPAIENYRIDSPSPDKLETLDALTDALGHRRTIVFVNHRESADRVYEHLRRRRSDVCLYHGGLDQDLRERALILFENGSCPLMVATDLAARGLDIADVAAVVHYHLPPQPEVWTHRNGRTGRMGADGMSFTIVSEKDSVPEFIDARAADIADIPPSDTPHTPTTTLYINAGRKEKISRGDVAGYMIARGGLSPSEVGRIDLKDHSAYVAVPAEKAAEVVAAVSPHKLKNTRVKVSVIK
ncbi:MAG: DEAD/DEAH box helicase, partial [Muribaculaceae bacterium]|nr:DEAD/DEAH box helicase [Muribaculaceae bacterium]